MMFPNRTSEMVKNRYYSYIRKKSRMAELLFELRLQGPSLQSQQNTTEGSIVPSINYLDSIISTQSQLKRSQSKSYIEVDTFPPFSVSFPGMVYSASEVPSSNGKCIRIENVHKLEPLNFSFYSLALMPPESHLQRLKQIGQQHQDNKGYLEESL